MSPQIPWTKNIAYAASCSWKAGPFLAKDRMYRRNSTAGKGNHGKAFCSILTQKNAPSVRRAHTNRKKTAISFIPQPHPSSNRCQVFSHIYIYIYSKIRQTSQHQRCTLPEASPPASFETSSTVTMLKSPSMLCFRQLAATANSMIC